MSILPYCMFACCNLIIFSEQHHDAAKNSEEVDLSSDDFSFRYPDLAAYLNLTTEFDMITSPCLITYILG